MRGYVGRQCTSCLWNVQFELIMKAAQEKIHVQDLLNIYSHEHLARYQQCPQILAEQLRDIETISQLAHSQFAEIVVDLRKKSLQYDKTFKVCDRLAKDALEQLRRRRTTSNNRFAYSIHSLNAQSIVSQFPQRRLLTELKLKFLESEGVDENCWENWFCAQEKILLIKDERNKFEIKFGIILTDENPPSLIWDVYDATSDSHHHPQLFFFLKEYTHWLKQKDKEWESKFISKLQLILDNLPSIFLFIAMRDDIRRRNGEQDQQTLKLTPVKNGTTTYVWKFEVFQQLQCPKVAFFINQQQFYQLQFKAGTYSGQLTISVFDKPLVLKHIEPIELQNRYFLYDFSMKLQHYHSILTKMGEKYNKINNQLTIFIILDGQLWKSDDLVLKEQDCLNITEGIWAQVKTEQGIIIRIDEDMSISYPEFERGFFNHFLPKLSISDLITHIYLRNQIVKHNKEYQFKLYRISYMENSSDFFYEFRSFKYSQQQKIFKLTKQQQEAMHMLSQANDNFVLILKVSADFSEVTFSAYKFIQGPQHTQVVADSFFPRKWKEYRDKTKGVSRYDWRKVAECMTYLCKCYLVERSYNKRMTEEQRRMTVYSFK